MDPDVTVLDRAGSACRIVCSQTQPYFPGEETKPGVVTDGPLMTRPCSAEPGPASGQSPPHPGDNRSSLDFQFLVVSEVGGLEGRDRDRALVEATKMKTFSLILEELAGMETQVS
jgi:hypothetical protein